MDTISGVLRVGPRLVRILVVGGAPVTDSPDFDVDADYSAFSRSFAHDISRVLIPVLPAPRQLRQ